MVNIGRLIGRKVKYQPGDTVGCYRSFTHSPMFKGAGQLEPHDCSWDDSFKHTPGVANGMGLAQLSNRLLLQPDGVSFLKEGMFGSANVKTPFGKVNKSDSRNFWTLVFDATNFAGPVAYFLPEFWKLRGRGVENVTRDFKDFSNVPNISISNPGWEVAQLKMFVQWNGTENVTKLPRMAFPNHNGRSVLWMGTMAHSDKDIIDPLEEALRTGELDPTKLLRNGVPPPSNRCGGASGAHFGDSGTVGTLNNHFNSAGDCVWSIKVANSSCPSDGLCETPQYYVHSKPIDASDAPKALQEARFPTQPQGGTKNIGQPYDALKYTPYGGCRDTPGPADHKLYCAQGVDGSWLGYRWYRFVDQPGLQQVKLTEEERAFMQTRVEKLHLMTPTPHNKWIPAGNAYAEGLATLDPAALTTPPKGLEHGYVPIVLYQGYDKHKLCA